MFSTPGRHESDPDTTGNSTAVTALLTALAPEGRLVVPSVREDPLPVSTGYLVWPNG